MSLDELGPTLPLEGLKIELCSVNSQSDCSSNCSDRIQYKRNTNHEQYKHQKSNSFASNNDKVSQSNFCENKEHIVKGQVFGLNPNNAPNCEQSNLSYSTQNSVMSNVEPQCPDYSHMVPIFEQSNLSYSTQNSVMSNVEPQCPDYSHMVPIFDVTGTYPLLSIENHNKLPQGVYENHVNCARYKQFIQQTTKEIGFIPLTDLKLYTGPDVKWDVVPNVLQAHKIIKDSGLPNFLSSRIPMQGPLKPEV